tara:strand:- start:887 stop:1399 length:513 start_codon:yes stop_codon:yes gene_type:complete
MTPQDTYAKQAYTKARETNTLTEQLLMIYDRIINSIEQAKQGMLNGQHEMVYNNLQKADSAIVGLMEAVDKDVDEKMFDALVSFYRDIDMQLLRLMSKDDTKLCEDIIDSLQIMRNAWAKAIQEQENTQEDSDTNTNTLEETNSEDSAETPPPSHEYTIPSDGDDFTITV